MADSAHIEGVGDPLQPVRVVDGVDLATQALNAMEGFILSRIDGHTSVSQLCVISGIGEQATIDVLRKLRANGLVVVGDEEPQARPGGGGNSSGGEGAAAAFAGVGFDEETLVDEDDDDDDDEQPDDSFVPPGDDEPRIRLTGDQLQASASGLHELDDDVVESELDNELHDDIDLDRDTRKTIRRMYAQLGDFNFFELLDVDPHADGREVRRAYFKRSKQFHPDRFYTRRLGRYKEMLAEIFKQVSAANNFLQDDDQRRAYAEMVLQEQASEHLGHELEAESRRLLEAEGMTDAAAAVDGSYTFTRKRGLSQREKVSKGLGEVQDVQAPTGPALAGPRTSRTGTAAALRNRVARRAGTLPKAVPRPVDTPERAARRVADRARRRARTASAHPAAHRRDRAERYYQDGMRQAAEGKHLAATASFRLALTFDDKNAEYKQAYERAFAISRDHTADGFFKRGIFEESVGRYETAGKLFVRAADVYPKAAYLAKAAHAMIWAEDLPKARDYATKAVQADSESADARVMLARVYLQSGMKKNARREVDMALKIEPGNFEAKELKKRMRRAW